MTRLTRLGSGFAVFGDYLIRDYLILKHGGHVVQYDNRNKLKKDLVICPRCIAPGCITQSAAQHIVP